MRVSDRALILLSCMRRGQRLTVDEICKKISCSRATFMRLKQELHLNNGIALVYDRSSGRYSLDSTSTNTIQIPGMCFTSRELIALCSLLSISEGLEPGLMKTILDDTKIRLNMALANELRNEDATSFIGNRIRILPMQKRQVNENVFLSAVQGLLQKVRLKLSTVKASTPLIRTISPQTLIYYRDNWYLDVWDHDKEALRTFSLVSIASLTLTKTRALKIGDRRLKEAFTNSYGIFSGKAQHTAIITFTGEGAKYASMEMWHSKQTKILNSNNSVTLHIPFGNHQELIRDIMRWADCVTIEQPAFLRKELCKALTTGQLNNN